MLALFVTEQSRIMSTSLRDQLLKAGLISKKQANDAERQQQRQERQPPKHKQPTASERVPVPQATQAARAAQAAKAARDQALNRRQHEKAEKKARLAQIAQLIEQNRVPTLEGDESYNFVDGAKIRRIAVNAANRARLSRGEIVIVRHDGRYHLVPVAIATRIRERDDSACIFSGVAKESAHSSDEAYQGFAVPDDLIW
jgi:uncharacterized protein YaiL (DUF2058 family)